MRKSCLSYVAVFVAVALGLFFFLLLNFPLSPPSVSPRLPPQPFRALIAGGAALVGALLATLAVALASGVSRNLRDLARLRASAAGAQPRDGERTVVYGTVRTEGRTLRSPVSGRGCVAYDYRVMGRAGSGRLHAVASGFALTPCLLETAAGPVRLRTHLVLEITPAIRSDEQARQTLGEYLATAPATSTPFDLRTNWEAFKEIVRDDDGAIRWDTRTGGSLDLSRCSIEEKVVAPGEAVAAFGRYSQSHGGVAPDPESPLLDPTRLRRGSLGRLSAGLIGGALGSALAGLLLLGVAALFVRYFLQHGPEFW